MSVVDVLIKCNTLEHDTKQLAGFTIMDISIQPRYVSMDKWNEQCRGEGEEEGNTGLAVTWASSQSSNGRMRGSEASRCE